MAKPPRFNQFTADQYQGAPSWFVTQFLPQLSETLTTNRNALNKGITRGDNLAASEKIGIRFTTKATVANTWPLNVKNQLPTKPKHVQIGQIYRTDGKPMANAFSLSWVLDGSGNIALTILGLEASTSYSLSIAYE